MRGLLVVSLALAGCDVLPRLCTAVYYECGLYVSFAEGLAAEGEWTVTAELADEVFTCSFALPADAGTQVGCVSPARQSRAYLVASDDGASVEGLKLANLHPDNLTITVALDGEEIHSETLAPDYDVTEPNGEGCGECYSGSAEISVSIPD